MPGRDLRIGDCNKFEKDTKSLHCLENDEFMRNEDELYVADARGVEDDKGCFRKTFCGRPSAGCLFRNVVLLVIVSGGLLGLALVFYTGGGDPRVFFTQEDPPGYTEANRWSTARTPGRLQLVISNSCEDRWTPAFDRYIQEWDNNGASPDALELQPIRLPYDFDCAEHPGRMNVCNGNYGNTDWRGINIAMIRNGFIISSVAKLNDFHLDQESDEQKLYTMCHEIGHGFGLPHTDEEYFNRDRGDCMDYTTRPGNNLAPGQFNFDLLDQLYGAEVDQTSQEVVSNSDLAPASENSNEKNKKADKDGEDRRHLHAHRYLEDLIPNSTFSKYLIARDVIESHEGGGAHEVIASHGIAAMQAGQHGELYHVDLGDGYTMVVDKLLATSRWNFDW